MTYSNTLFNLDTDWTEIFINQLGKNGEKIVKITPKAGEFDCGLNMWRNNILWERNKRRLLGKEAKVQGIYLESKLLGGYWRGFSFKNKVSENLIKKCSAFRHLHVRVNEHKHRQTTVTNKRKKWGFLY